MANYYGMCRTNYFAVTDAVKFKAVMDCVSGEAAVRFFEHDIEKGKFMFYCEGNITGYITDSDDEDALDGAYDKMIEMLQGVLPDGEVIILTEIGNEKMRYLHAASLLITNNGTHFIDLADVAVNKAREILNNPGYCTGMYY